MSATYEIHVVSVEELGDDVGAERERDASIVLAPALHVLVRIGPEQVAQETRVGHVRRPHDAPYLLHGLEVGRQAAVTAEDLLVDDGRYWQTIEAIGERLPKFDVKASLA